MDQDLKNLLERCKAEERSAQTALYRRFASRFFAQHSGTLTAGMKLQTLRRKAG